MNLPAVLLVTLLAVAVPRIAFAADCPAAPAALVDSIQSHIHALEAAEDCDARRVKEENGLAVVIYTAEGACAQTDPGATPGSCSNNWVRYMVAMSGSRITSPVQVGGKGGLTDMSIRFRNGTIEVVGLSVGPSDAMCCPSVHETKRFRIVGSSLRELR